MSIDRSIFTRDGDGNFIVRPRRSADRLAELEQRVDELDRLEALMAGLDARVTRLERTQAAQTERLALAGIRDDRG